MTDQELMLQAVGNAQHILEEYLEPRPHDNERLLSRLVEVLDPKRRGCRRRSVEARLQSVAH
jgi:hypothetical protein